MHTTVLEFLLFLISKWIFGFFFPFFPFSDFDWFQLFTFNLLIDSDSVLLYYENLGLSIYSILDSCKLFTGIFAN